MPLGLYISVPFCRQKCSYCNFASGVFAPAQYERYVDRVSADMAGIGPWLDSIGARIERHVDTVYLGGGTPTVLSPGQLQRLFAAARSSFQVAPGAEITVECAPGTISPATIELLQACGVNRVSLGVQSFVDEEARAVGRMHTRAVALEEIARLQAAGLENISLDLIAGLPHQTRDSWDRSLTDVIAAQVAHVSVYMLEVDDESRLGRELLAGGTRYHAHFVPDSDAVAELYLYACERLEAAGIGQYEISNFARPGLESRHNLKYWTRQPYLGFGLDAHSMAAPQPEPRQAGMNMEMDMEIDAVRFHMPDALEEFLARPATWQPPTELISRAAALEETFFLGLRLNRGLSLAEVERSFGAEALAGLDGAIAELVQNGLLARQAGALRLTPRGRLLSNEVFEAFVSLPAPSD